MSRIHLFEFEDFSWFPLFLRNYLIGKLEEKIRSGNEFIFAWNIKEIEDE
jgi:hypothetical protein